MKKIILISLLFSLISCSSDYKYFCIDNQPYYLKYYCMEYIDVKRKTYKDQNADSLIFLELREIILSINDDALFKIKEHYGRK